MSAAFGGCRSRKQAKPVPFIFRLELGKGDVCALLDGSRRLVFLHVDLELVDFLVDLLESRYIAIFDRLTLLALQVLQRAVVGILLSLGQEIGRASCRERVCQYV